MSTIVHIIIIIAIIQLIYYYTQYYAIIDSGLIKIYLHFQEKCMHHLDLCAWSKRRLDTYSN